MNTALMVVGGLVAFGLICFVGWVAFAGSMKH